MYDVDVRDRVVPVAMFSDPTAAARAVKLKNIPNAFITQRSSLTQQAIFLIHKYRQDGRSE
jgi:hypothetical protein